MYTTKIVNKNDYYYIIRIWDWCGLWCIHFKYSVFKQIEISFGVLFIQRLAHVFLGLCFTIVLVSIGFCYWPFCSPTFSVCTPTCFLLLTVTNTLLLVGVVNFKIITEEAIYSENNGKYCWDRPSCVIKDYTRVFIETLFILFNKTFSHLWKILKVCPAFKASDINVLGNCRLTNILCNFSIWKYLGKNWNHFYLVVMDL